VTIGLLETRLDLGKRTSQPSPPLERRYNTRKADWEVFLKIVAEEKSALGVRVITFITAEEVKRMAERTQGILRKACDAAIPKKRWHIRSTPWWTAEFTRAKRNTYRARRRYQGPRNEGAREAAVQTNKERVHGNGDETRAKICRRRKAQNEGASEKTIKQEAVRKWQERWQSTRKGRITFEYFGAVRERLECS
jgi:transposase